MLSLVLVHYRDFRRVRAGKLDESYFMIASFTVPKSLHIPTDEDKLHSTQVSLVIAFVVVLTEVLCGAFLFVGDYSYCQKQSRQKEKSHGRTQGTRISQRLLGNGALQENGITTQDT